MCEFVCMLCMCEREGEEWRERERKREGEGVYVRASESVLCVYNVRMSVCVFIKLYNHN